MLKFSEENFSQISNGKSADGEVELQCACSFSNFFVAKICHMFEYVTIVSSTVEVPWIRRMIGRKLIRCF